MKRPRQAAAAIALLAGLWGAHAGQAGERQAQTAPALEEIEPSRRLRWDLEPFKARPAMDMPPERPRPDPIGPLILTEQVRPTAANGAELFKTPKIRGKLEFRIAPTLPSSAREPKLAGKQHEYYLKQLADQGPMFGRSRNEPYQWFELRAKSERFSTDMVIGKYAGKRYVLLCNQRGLAMLRETGRRSWKLQATPGLDILNRPAVHFRLDDRGAKLMAALTVANVGRLLAVLLDDQVYSAPNIWQTIYGNGIIEGDFTRRQVDEIVRALAAGPSTSRRRGRSGGGDAGRWYLLLLPVVLGGGILVYVWVARGRRRVAQQPQEGE